MLTLLYPIAAVIVGFIAVVWGADRFVYGSAGVARNLGVSRLVIGLTIVAFGTSAPEMLVSGMAAAAGSAQMGIGNAIGSNITNVTLVLGAAALVSPMSVHSRLLLREIPILLLAMAMAWAFLWDGRLTRVEGLSLFAGLVAVAAWLTFAALRGQAGDAGALTEGLDDDEIPDSLPSAKAVGLWTIGLVCLLVGSRVLVWGAAGIARDLGVSELVVGLTIVALGTSLPELAASVAAARRGEDDIAIGNVVGSNIFNLLGVLALPGVIAPGEVDRSVMVRDVPIMVGTALLMLFMVVSKQSQLGRKRGTVLLLLFVAYFVMLFAFPSLGAAPR